MMRILGQVLKHKLPLLNETRSKLVGTYPSRPIGIGGVFAYRQALNRNGTGREGAQYKTKLPLLAFSSPLRVREAPP
jgi:hypothetical protein